MKPKTDRQIAFQNKTIMRMRAKLTQSKIATFDFTPSERACLLTLERDGVIKHDGKYWMLTSKVQS